MAVRVAINHSNTYHYDRRVSLSLFVFRLRTPGHSHIPIEGFSLKIKPENHFIKWQQDEAPSAGFTPILEQKMTTRGKLEKAGTIIITSRLLSM